MKVRNLIKMIEADGWSMFEPVAATDNSITH
jgi:hypothetical protein